MIPSTHNRPTAQGVQFQATCFACGSDNPHGLRLKFHVDPCGTATAELALSPQWEGPRGIIHGGIASTLLDEAMAKAAATTGCKAMTAELRVRFRESAKTGERLQLRGWVVRQEKRLVETEATLLATDGKERAHAWGKFVVVAIPKPQGAGRERTLNLAPQHSYLKEKHIMKIAIPTNDGTSISEHFGRSAAFLIFEAENGQIQNQTLKTNGQEHSHDQGSCGHDSTEHAPHGHQGILSALDGCEVVICAGMGQRAAEALQTAGINQIVFTTLGSAHEAVSSFLAGKLIPKTESFCRCSH